MFLKLIFSASIERQCLFLTWSKSSHHWLSLVFLTATPTGGSQTHSPLVKFAYMCSPDRGSIISTHSVGGGALDALLLPGLPRAPWLELLGPNEAPPPPGGGSELILESTFVKKIYFSWLHFYANLRIFDTQAKSWISLSLIPNLGEINDNTHETLSRRCLP